MRTIQRLLPLLLTSTLVVPSCNVTRPTASSAEAAEARSLVPSTLGSTERVHEQGGFLLASQPSEADLELAASRGVRTVIDQRKPTEDRGFDELAVVSRLGMAYVNPSFSKPEELTDAMLDQSRELMRTVQRPVLMHCASGNRTGAVWLAYRVLDDGIELDRAVEEAKAVGMRSPEYEARVRDYIARKRVASR